MPLVHVCGPSSPANSFEIVELVELNETCTSGSCAVQIGGRIISPGCSDVVGSVTMGEFAP